MLQLRYAEPKKKPYYRRPSSNAQSTQASSGENKVKETPTHVVAKLNKSTEECPADSNGYRELFQLLKSSVVETKVLLSPVSKSSEPEKTHGETETCISSENPFLDTASLESSHTLSDSLTASRYSEHLEKLLSSLRHPITLPPPMNAHNPTLSRPISYPLLSNDLMDSIYPGNTSNSSGSGHGMETNHLPKLSPIQSFNNFVPPIRTATYTDVCSTSDTGATDFCSKTNLLAPKQKPKLAKKVYRKEHFSDYKKTWTHIYKAQYPNWTKTQIHQRVLEKYQKEYGTC